MVALGQRSSGLIAARGKAKMISDHSRAIDLSERSRVRSRLHFQGSDRKGIVKAHRGLINSL